MANYNKHKPSQSYAGVHISQKEVSLEYFYVQKAIIQYVFCIFKHYGWTDKRSEKPAAVFAGHMLEYSCKSYEEIYEYKGHSNHKWQDKIVISP